jgi:hypothetical protein
MISLFPYTLMAQSLSDHESLCRPVTDGDLKGRLIDIADTDLKSRGYTLKKGDRMILVEFCRDFYFVTQSSEDGLLGGVNYTFIDIQGRIFQSLILG